MMFSSSMGPDGKMKTEKFASNAVGDFNNRMQEVQQAYSNSDTGIDKMSMERQLQGRGRKMVKEYNRHSGEERNTDMYKGMTEEQTPDFDRQWQAQAVPRLPQHTAGGVQSLMNGGGSGPRAIGPGQSYQSRALPPSQTQYAGRPSYGS